MIIRHTQEQINEYYQRIGVNQSSLKVLINDGVQAFALQKDSLQSKDDLYYEEKKHFIIGSAVDCRLTQGQDVFENTYHFSKLIKKPGEKAMSVIKLAYDKAKERYSGIDVDITAYRKEIFEAADEQDYYTNRRNKEGDWNVDTRIATLIKDNGQDYWADLSLAEGKQVLSDDEQNIINSIILSLTTHKHSAHLFQETEGADIIFQLPLYFTYSDVDCKGMIDMIIVNHKARKIFVVDIKTLGDLTMRFNRAIRKRRYDLQGSFYTYGLKQSLGVVSDLVGKDVRSYTIANFAFMVESTIKPGCPMIYVLDDTILTEGEKGNAEEGLLGWVQGIEIYKAWEAVDFSPERMYAASNGVIIINKETLNSIT